MMEQEFTSRSEKAQEVSCMGHWNSQWNEVGRERVDLKIKRWREEKGDG